MARLGRDSGAGRAGGDARPFSYTDIPDLAGRTALVTGANSGLGLHTCRGLAGAGAQVLMAVRDTTRGQSAAERIRDEYPWAVLEVVELNLANLSSVRNLSAQLHSERVRLDILVNNGGIMMPPFEETVDGFESQLGTNYLGHFALTSLLFDLLLATDAPRVVTVSSYTNHGGEIRLDDLSFAERGYDPMAAYQQSKLANLMFAIELDRRAKIAGLTLVSSAAHPGHAATELTRNAPTRSTSVASRARNLGMRIADRLLGSSAADGALPQIFAAVGEGVTGGTYWGPTQRTLLPEMRGPVGPARISPKALDPSVARKLFALSSDLTSAEFPFRDS